MQVVKRLWEVIKANNMQNPADGREIVNNDAFEAVFECKTMNMFSMNKKLSKHLT